jgi:hypothetical protein
VNGTHRLHGKLQACDCRAFDEDRLLRHHTRSTGCRVELFGSENIAPGIECIEFECSVRLYGDMWRGRGFVLREKAYMGDARIPVAYPALYLRNRRGAKFQIGVSNTPPFDFERSRRRTGVA